MQINKNERQHGSNGWRSVLRMFDIVTYRIKIYLLNNNYYAGDLANGEGKGEKERESHSE